MYNIKFKCETLTGEVINQVLIDDDRLDDTWTVFTIGEVPVELKAVGCDCTHDLNVWFDEELCLSLYPLINDPLSGDQAPQTDYSSSIRCKIIDVHKIN